MEISSVVKLKKIAKDQHTSVSKIIENFFKSLDEEDLKISKKIKNKKEKNSFH